VAALGVLEELPERRFRLTELGDGLRTDAPGSVAGWAVFIGRRPNWMSWLRLTDSVRTGETGFDLEYGTDVWTFRATDPEETAVFNRAMNSMSDAVADAVVATYDFNQFSRIVDVGGGGGLLLTRILAANPRLEGVLFDQPQVVDDAAAFVQGSGVADRCRLLGGSFFDPIPVAADAYLLKSILHDWNDEDAIRILAGCRRVMPAGSRVLVIERVIGEPNVDPEAKFGDLNMMTAVGGRERTEAEWKTVFEAAGVRLSRILETGRPLKIIEALPA
jgi:hypothetical protein